MIIYSWIITTKVFVSKKIVFTFLQLVEVTIDTDVILVKHENYYMLLDIHVQGIHGIQILQGFLAINPAFQAFILFN